MTGLRGDDTNTSRPLNLNFFLDSYPGANRESPVLLLTYKAVYSTLFYGLQHPSAIYFSAWPCLRRSALAGRLCSLPASERSPWGCFG